MARVAGRGWAMTLVNAGVQNAMAPAVAKASVVCAIRLIAMSVRLVLTARNTGTAPTEIPIENVTQRTGPRSAWACFFGMKCEALPDSSFSDDAGDSNTIALSGAAG
jgi:hypothetical protein